MDSSLSTAERRDLQSIKDRRAWNSYAAQRRIFNRKLRTRDQEKKKLEELIQGYLNVINNVVEPLVRDLSALRQFSANMESNTSAVTGLFQTVCLLGATVAKHKYEVSHMEERLQKVEVSINEINNPNKKKQGYNKTIAKKKSATTVTTKPNLTTSSRRVEPSTTATRSELPTITRREVPATRREVPTITRKEVPTTTRREVPNWVMEMCGGHHPDSESTSSSAYSDSASSISTEEYYDRFRVHF